MRFFLLALLLISFSLLLYSPGITLPDGPFTYRFWFDGQSTSPINPVNFTSKTVIIETHPGGALTTIKSPGTTSYSTLTITVPATVGSPVDPVTYREYGQARLDTWYNLPSSNVNRVKDGIVNIYTGQPRLQASYKFYHMTPQSRTLWSVRGTSYVTYTFTYTQFERDLEVLP